MEKKIPKEVTIGILESIVDETCIFKDFGPLTEIQTMDIEGFVPDFTGEEYIEVLRAGMEGRIDYLESLKITNGGRDALPEEAEDIIKELVEKLK